MGQKGNPVLTVMVITAAVVTPLVLLGVFLGYYVGGMTGYSKSILAIVFSTVGFLVAMAVLSRAIVRIAGKSGAARS